MIAALICVLGIAVSVAAVAGWRSAGSTTPGEGHAPDTAAQRDATRVVQAYDRAIRAGDAAAVCRIVGGAELDAFRCRATPAIPANRRATLLDPRALLVIENSERSITLNGSVAGTDMGLHVTLRPARRALRVTRVRLGYTF